MAHTVKTADLQAGMKVVSPILGKKGNIKVNAGEILSGLHVEKLKKWVGVDAANPNGIQVESSPLHSGTDVPTVIDQPWKSPLIEQKAKQNLQSRVSVPAILDENGKLLNPSPLERELAAREEKTNEPVLVEAKHRGRPPKVRA